jgi:hypothetical protein
LERERSRVSKKLSISAETSAIDLSMAYSWGDRLVSPQCIPVWYHIKITYNEWRICSGHKVGVVDALAELAGAAGDLGQLKRGARLFGAADAFYDMHGFVLATCYRQDYERSRASVREQHDRATFNALWAEGQAMSLEEAIAYALEESASDE